jgi:MoaA/NifB/PqqE/SkfB family radical SAM enzyme
MSISNLSSAGFDSVQWRINCLCDTRCAYCYGPEKLNEVHDLSETLPVLDKMMSAGIGTFVITGGEPLLSSKVGRAIRHLHANGAKVVLFTNCDFWEFHDEILTECLDTVCVPIEGASEYVHDMARGRNNMRAVISVLERYAKKDGPFKVNVGTVVGRHNLNDLSAILYLLERYEINAWTLYRYVRYTDRGLQKLWKTSQLGISTAEYEAAVKAVMAESQGNIPITLSTEVDREQDCLMLNPDLDIVVPVRDESGAIADKVICSAKDRNMNEIQELWGDTVDWRRYAETLNVALF